MEPVRSRDACHRAFRVGTERPEKRIRRTVYAGRDLTVTGSIVPGSASGYPCNSPESLMDFFRRHFEDEPASGMKDETGRIMSEWKENLFLA